MPLPLVRDLTINPTDPVPSSLLNKLQDMVIGAKFGPTPVSLGGSAFQVIGAATPLLNAGGLWTFSAAGLLSSGLRLAEGTKITALTWAYNRGGAGTMQLRLYKRNILGGGAAVSLDLTTINAGTGYTTTTKNPNYTVEVGYEVSLVADCDNAAHQFGGAAIVIERS